MEVDDKKALLRDMIKIYIIADPTEVNVAKCAIKGRLALSGVGPILFVYELPMKCRCSVTEHVMGLVRRE